MAITISQVLWESVHLLNQPGDSSLDSFCSLLSLIDLFRPLFAGQLPLTNLSSRASRLAPLNNCLLAMVAILVWSIFDYNRFGGLKRCGFILSINAVIFIDWFALCFTVRSLFKINDNEGWISSPPPRWKWALLWIQLALHIANFYHMHVCSLLLLDNEIRISLALF